MIPYIRIYDASVINYLKYEVLPPYFTEWVEDEPLVYNADLQGFVTESDMLPLPTSPGRGWVFFDEETINGVSIVSTSAEQATQVIVAGPSTYTVDYVRGRILTPDATPTTVSYAWNYVSLVEGWPGEDIPPLPVVAVDMVAVSKKGFQLGGGTKDTLEGSVHIFATSEMEKKDLTDVIYQAFYNRSVPIRNWHEGSYLSYDGSYSGFQPTTVSGLSSAVFTNVEARLDGPRIDWSEVNRHRSRINFVLEIYKS